MATKKTEINYDEILTIEKGKLVSITDGSYKELSLPSTVKSIAKDAFGSAKIKKLILPESVKKIIGQNFKANAGITEIVISTGTESIGKEAFAGCKSLKKVTLPDSLTEIGEKAFKDCAKLTEIKIPSSVKTLGDACFSGCKSLSDVTFDKSEINGLDFGRLFKDCKKLINVNMIDSSYYNSCNGVIFDKKMKDIKFVGEGVKKLTLPDSITATTISTKIKKLRINYTPNTKMRIEIDTTSIDDIEFIVAGKTFQFNLEKAKYSLEQYGYHYFTKELYPKKKEQVLELLNDIINIMFTGKCADNFGKAIYSGAGGYEEIIEPMIELRIALSEAISDIYGVNRNNFFTELFEPVVDQNDIDVAEELHNEVTRFFMDNPDKRIYLTSFPELQKEIEKVK